MLDITWTIVAHVPQLDALQQTLLEIGATIVGEISGIQNAINSLVTNQADGQEALAAHLTAIENEIRQLGANPTQAELDHLADQVNAAAATTTKAAADLRAMTEQVSGMVPDTPPPA
jgi:hypothetical protein